jgi:hypothetical protein
VRGRNYPPPQNKHMHTVHTISNVASALYGAQRLVAWAAVAVGHVPCPGRCVCRHLGSQQKFRRMLRSKVSGSSVTGALIAGQLLDVAVRVRDVRPFAVRKMVRVPVLFVPLRMLVHDFPEMEAMKMTEKARRGGNACELANWVHGHIFFPVRCRPSSFTTAPSAAVSTRTAGWWQSLHLPRTFAASSQSVLSGQPPPLSHNSMS